MPNNLGQRGETLAADYLAAAGYEIVARNWRYGHGEIDLIASIKDQLVIVEVKTRRAGEPESAMTQAKESRLATTAQAYMAAIDWTGEVRFDVISILMPHDQSAELTHYEDAFFPGLG